MVIINILIFIYLTVRITYLENKIDMLSEILTYNEKLLKKEFKAMNYKGGDCSSE